MMRLSSSLVLTALLCSPAFADPVTGGSILNLLTPGVATLQSAIPSVASHPSGRTLVTWVQSTLGTPLLKYAVLSDTGAQLVTATTITPGPGEVPLRCKAGVGPVGFYLTFEGPNSVTDPRTCVMFRSFNLQGQIQGAGVANFALIEHQAQSSIAGYPNGDFLVTWVIQAQQPGQPSLGVFGRRFTNFGVPVDANDVRLDTVNLGAQTTTAVAIWPDGTTVVVWQDGTYNGTTSQPSFDGHGAAILGRWYTQSLSPITGQQVCNQVTAADQFDAHVAVDQRDTCTVGWCGDNPSTGRIDAYSRRFTIQGAPLDATDLLLSQNHTTIDQLLTGLSMNHSGEAVATWMNATALAGQPSPQCGYARVSSLGQRIEEGVLDAFSSSNEGQSFARVGMDQYGNFQAAWQVSTPSGIGVRTRPYRRNCITFSNQFPQQGSVLGLTLDSPSDAGRLYVVAASLGSGPLPLDTRSIPLSYDFLFQYTLLFGGAPFFNNLVGNLDASGTSTAPQMYIPVAGISGVNVRFGFVTGEPAAPSSVNYVSNAYVVTIL